VVHAHAADLRNVPIEDEGAYLDVDTEAEYAAVVERLRVAG
jgi:CTP:molybdopterin cytidylyltransferase MocA